jgi:uncharacterized membrane protein YgcG
MKIKGKVINLWAKYDGTFIPVHTKEPVEQEAEIEIELTEMDINQIIRNHFSTIFLQNDFMIGIIEAGNESAKSITKALTNTA